MTHGHTHEAPVDTVDCPHCGTTNRVPAAASGTPHCGNCQQALPWVTTANDDTFDEVIAQSSLPVLLDLWAPWCGPCRVVEPGIKEAARTYAGAVKAVKVNVDEADAIAQRYEAQSIPMILVLHQGEVHRRQIGALPPPELVRWVGDALN